jgi:shikimate dehydrogenase
VNPLKNTATFGLIGKNLEHSWSKSYFEKKFREEQLDGHVYKNYELNDLSELQDIIRSDESLTGLNVTIPYKEQILNYIDKIDPVAKAIGAINVVRISRNRGKVYLAGYNTDAQAFAESVEPILTKGKKSALVLGTGGASKAVQFALNQLNITYTQVSRNAGPGKMVYAGLTPAIIKRHQIIINTTPLGMFPVLTRCPLIPYNELTNRHLLYDLIYNPEETLFLRKGREKGAKIKNGLEMLHIQADLSWKLWKD